MGLACDPTFGRSLSRSNSIEFLVHQGGCLLKCLQIVQFNYAAFANSFVFSEQYLDLGKVVEEKLFKCLLLDDVNLIKLLLDCVLVGDKLLEIEVYQDIILDYARKIQS